MHLAGWMQKFNLEKELHEVYLHSFVFRLATSLISIFIPLYVIELGFPALYAITFYLIYNFAILVSILPLTVLASKIGYKHLSLYSGIGWLSFYLFLRAVEDPISLHLAGVIGGIGFAMYWIGMNPEVATSTDDGKEDEESGFFFSMPSLADIISPFVGGLILATLGFSSLFLLSTALVALSFTPFLFSREHFDGMNIKFRSLISREYFDDFFAYFFEGFQSVGHVVMWPLYVAIIVGGSINIGGVGSLLALGAAISSVFVGKLSEKYGRNKVLFYGPTCLAIVAISMSLTGSAAFAFLISLMHGLFHNSLSVPLYGSAIERSEQTDLLEYFAFRETALTLGRISMLTLVAIGFIMVPDYRYIAAFGLMAAGIIASSFYARRIG